MENIALFVSCYNAQWQTEEIDAVIPLDTRQLSLYATLLEGVVAPVPYVTKSAEELWWGLQMI